MGDSRILVFTRCGEDFSEMEMKLASFTVNMAGCRYQVIPCDDRKPGAERVLRSEHGMLLTEAHTLHNPFILPVDAQFVLIRPIN